MSADAQRPGLHYESNPGYFTDRCSTCLKNEPHVRTCEQDLCSSLELILLYGPENILYSYTLSMGVLYFTLS